MSVLFLFIDGIGVGDEDRAVNPFVFTSSRIFHLTKSNDAGDVYPHTYFDNGYIRSIECSMGVDGLPQSASGQTALFTGVNTAKLLGRHLSGFPTRSLKKILREKSIMVLLERKGYRVLFANAFTPPYFEKKITRVSATTAMAEGCNRRIRNFRDLEKGGAVFMDLTNKWLIANGYWVTPRTIKEAAEVLARVTAENDFTLFEYFITDVRGHRGDFADAVEQAKILEELITTIWSNLDHDEDLLLITSDHGNLEDMSVKTHTNNRIPLILAGKGAESLIGKINKITEVTPALLEEFDSIISGKQT